MKLQSSKRTSNSEEIGESLCYEGRHGIEDTRKAVLEARGKGLSVFAVTVDRRAKSYVPFIFGRGGYAMVGHLGRLPEALAGIYRQLVS